MSRKTLLDEAAMQAAESMIPRLATQAGRAAHQRALNETGRVVMKSADGQLVEQRSDGTVTVLKTLPASTPVQKGAVLTRATKSNLKQTIKR